MRQPDSCRLLRALEQTILMMIVSARFNNA